MQSPHTLGIMFPSTSWTLLAQASLHGDTTAAQALEEFCRRYRGAVVKFMSWRGVGEDRAEDLAHDFLVQLMTHSSLKRADPGRGRFRSFLAGALGRFLSDQADRSRAQKRGGGQAPLSLDADPALADISAENGNAPTPLDHAWALHLMDQAIIALRTEWASSGKQARWALLSAFLPGAAAPPCMDAVALELGISAAGVRSEVKRLRDRFREILRSEVARTVSRIEDVDEELRHLRRTLSDPGMQLPEPTAESTTTPAC